MFEVGGVPVSCKEALRLAAQSFQLKLSSVARDFEA
jgi:hypothetical protein